jgi:hypothetical protein
VSTLSGSSPSLTTSVTVPSSVVLSVASRIVFVVDVRPGQNLWVDAGDRVVARVSNVQANRCCVSP